MTPENKPGMQCTEFDTLLSEALDGALTGSERERFQAHAQVCAVCSPLLKEAQAGLRWLTSLEEVEPPPQLVRNILSATTGLDKQSHAAPSRTPWWERLWSTVFAPVAGVIRQPRFAMSFGMAFFSLSVSMSLTGVRLGDLRRVDLRPSAIRRSYYETSGRVIKYYENIRFVYELESRVREFKRMTAPPPPPPAEKPKERNDNTSGQPEPRQERNYSQGESQPLLAAAPDSPPVVMVTTYRRCL